MRILRTLTIFYFYFLQLCGAITPEVWPGVENLDLYNKMELPKGSKRRVKERLKHYVKDPYACDLIGELFTLLKYSRVWPVGNVCFIKKTLTI